MRWTNGENQLSNRGELNKFCAWSGTLKSRKAKPVMEFKWKS